MKIMQKLIRHDNHDDFQERVFSLKTEELGNRVLTNLIQTKSHQKKEY